MWNWENCSVYKRSSGSTSPFTQWRH